MLAACATHLCCWLLPHQVLSYHVVKGIKPLPNGFKSGEPVATLLAGQDLKVDLEK